MAFPVVPPRIFPAAPIVARSPSELVGRAAAILARQTPVPVSPGAAGVPDLPPHSPELEDLRQRAVALVSDLGRLLETPQPPLTPALPWRRPRVPAPAGGSTSLALKLENLEEGPVKVSLSSSDLLSDRGRSIPARAISFDPVSLNIGARQQAAVTIRVAVPAHSPPGEYSGLVQAAGLPGVKVVITVEVS